VYRCGSNWSAMAAAWRMCTQPIAGRALPVTLTDAGQSILDQADEIVLDVEKRMVASLPPGEVQRLASLLTACARSLT
jgi:hypothetical protein